MCSTQHLDSPWVNLDSRRCRHNLRWSTCSKHRSSRTTTTVQRRVFWQVLLHVPSASSAACAAKQGFRSCVQFTHKIKYDRSIFDECPLYGRNQSINQFMRVSDLTNLM